MLQALLDFILHLDRHLIQLLADYGSWTYGILFLIVLMETGLVVTPFLPGDSLLFVAGTLAAGGGMDIWLLFGLLASAAILGDALNFWIGRLLGERAYKLPDNRWFKQAYLSKTHDFYERHGGKTIIIARFIPILRTFAPFVAGVGRMSYLRFAAFNVVGGILWVASFLAAGYFFGNIPAVKQNLTLVIFGIIILSTMPGILTYLRHKTGKR
ncbi:DedA family protein [Halothiobacillus sp. DCM-1]|uniref:DedA family protein n=1 Tax=Halothiobacillus sp. DCM-1 TaxID=3112558 RepID=UPI00325216AE